MENSLPTLLEDALEPPVPLTHIQLLLELMYGASWPLYFTVSPDLMISTIVVQLGMILASLLDSGANSNLESGRGLHSETARDGCSALNIRLLDAPHVARLIIPQWRRPDRRDRVTVPHDATIPPLPISTKIYPREPKIAEYSNTCNSVIPIPFSDFTNAH
jgi:hypothetical protein